MGTLTVANIIEDAINRSSMNDTNLISDTRAVRIIDRAQRAAYIRAARENPEYFGTSGNTSTRAAYTDSWDISSTPGRIAAITKLEVAAITGTPTPSVGDEVHMVNFRHPSLAFTPRVYVRGQTITDVGTDLGSADTDMVTSLKVYYSPIPAAFTSTSDAITLPDVWADLLILPLARVMAVKDGQRENEVRDLREEYAEILEQFIEAVKIYDYGAVRSTPAIRPLPAPQPAR